MLGHPLFDNLTLSPESKRVEGYFFRTEEFQLTLFLAICKMFSPNIVLDIGANVGFYTVVTRKYFTNPEYHCFEPTPETFAELSGNIVNTFHDERIRAYNMALSSVKDRANFLDFGTMSGRNSIQTTTIHPASGVKQISVETDCLDNLFEGLRGAKVQLKVDVEGHEAEVFKGGQKLLAGNACVIQMEAGINPVKTAAENVLEEMGYTRLFITGADRYYSNDPDFLTESTRLALLESAVNLFVDHRSGRNPLARL